MAAPINGEDKETGITRVCNVISYLAIPYDPHTPIVISKSFAKLKFPGKKSKLQRASTRLTSARVAEVSASKPACKSRSEPQQANALCPKNQDSQPTERRYTVDH